MAIDITSYFVIPLPGLKSILLELFKNRVALAAVQVRCMFTEPDYERELPKLPRKTALCFSDKMSLEQIKFA